MRKVLFIDACVRPGSRTRALAEVLLQKLDAQVERVCLYETVPQALDADGMEIRAQASQNKDFSDPVFAAAKQFAAADTIVIAAPYWDMMFPAVLKTYLETITVAGITFRYTASGRPEGLCRAKALHYVTTAGGFIGQNDFGFCYLKALAENFFAIPEVYRYAAEGLDILGADVEGIMEEAKAAILGASQAHTIPYPGKYERSL